MTETMTICVECKHYVKSTLQPTGNSGMRVMLHYLCGKHGTQAIDPVHGTRNKVLPECRDINKGNCEDWEMLDAEWMRAKAKEQNAKLDQMVEDIERMPWGLLCGVRAPWDLTLRERLKSWLGMEI